MKRKFILLLIFLSTVSCFSQNYQKMFLKGNISDKITAVKEASGEEAYWLSRKSIEFISENKDILKSDRDFEGLVIATILSLPIEYVEAMSDIDKKTFISILLDIYENFSSSNNVLISIHSKILHLESVLDTTSFKNYLNNYLQTVNIYNESDDIYKSVLNTVSVIGDNVTFAILYNNLNDSRYSAYYPEIENAITKLIDLSYNEIIQIINSKDIYQINNIFSIIKNNKSISQNFLSEIAENILNEVILLVDDSSNNKELLIDLQMDALKVLTTNKWTRASETVIKLFNVAKKEYNNKLLSENQYIDVIKSLGSIAPLDAVLPLINSLEELNAKVENENVVSQNVALTIVETLGAIGDKTAFDTLLSVTYLNYSEAVLSAARKALAGLKW